MYAEVRPKIVPTFQGAKTPQGPLDGWAIALVGAAGGSLHETRNGAILCARWEACSEARPKIVPAGQRAKMPQRPRDEWAIFLVGAAGGGLRGTRNFARDYKGPHGSRRVGRAEARPNIVPQAGAPKVTQGPEMSAL